MKIEPDLIREILIALAEQQNRPHFENGLVKDVLEAFRQNCHHHLKAQIMEFYQENYSKESNVGTAQVDSSYLAECQLKLRKLCNTRERMRVLTRCTGLEFSVVSSLAKGRRPLTPKIWEKVEPELDHLDKNKELQNIRGRFLNLKCR